MNAQNFTPIIQLINSNSLAGYKSDTVIRRASYVESFAVEENEPESRAKVVQANIDGIKKYDRNRPILVCISVSGIKICSTDGQTVHMAHALRRISYSTCDVRDCRIAFVAREPNPEISLQYCHVFVTESSESAEELNQIIGNAFKLAYAKQSLLKSNLLKKEIREGLASLPLLSDQFPTCPIAELSPIDLAPLLGLELPPPPTCDPPPAPTELTRENSIIQKEIENPTKLDLEKHLHRISTPLAPEISAQRRQHNQSNNNPTPSSRIFSNFRKSSGSSNPNQSRSSSRSNSNNRNSKNFVVSSLATTNTTVLDLSNYDSSLGSPVVMLKEQIEAEAHKHAEANAKAEAQAILDLAHQVQVSNQQSDHNLLNNGVSKICRTPSPPLPPVRLNSLRRFLASGSADSPENNLTSARSQLERLRRSNRKISEQPLSIEHANPKMNLPTAASADNLHAQTENTQNTKSVSHQQNLELISTGFTSKKEGLAKEKPLPFFPSSEEVKTLRSATWYQAFIPREVALELLSKEDVGSFIVRDSVSHPNCCALSVRVVPNKDNPVGITHYLIERTPAGHVKLQRFDKEWNTLSDLIQHLTVMPEILPCTLKMPDQNITNFSFSQIESVDPMDIKINNGSVQNGTQLQDGIDSVAQESRWVEDEDYQRLSDFSTLMAQLGNQNLNSSR